jgi:hypothetical protein
MGTLARQRAALSFWGTTGTPRVNGPECLDRNNVSLSLGDQASRPRPLKRGFAWREQSA